MSRRALGILFLFSLCACSSTLTLTRPPAAQDIQWANRNLGDHDVTVRRADETSLELSGVQIQRDGTLESTRSTPRVTVPPELWREVTYTSHGQGAVAGLFVGGGVGLAVALGLNASRNCSHSPDPSICSGLGSMESAGLGLLIAVAGTVIGGAIGQTTTVTMEPVATSSTHR